MATSRRARSGFIVSAAALASLAGPVPAPLTPLAVAAEQEQRSYENEAREARGRASYMAGVFASAENGTDWAGALARPDLPPARKAFEAELAGWEKLAALYDQRRPAEAEAYRKGELAALEKSALAWRMRLEARGEQRRVIPDEQQYSDTVAWLPAAARPAYDVLVTARRRASEAWARYAEGLTEPGATEAAVGALREEALTLTAEAEAAGIDYDWTQQRARMMPDAELTSGELRRLTEEHAKAQRERVALRREQIARDRRARELDARREALEKELAKAYEAAYKAREEARRHARKQ